MMSDFTEECPNCGNDEDLQFDVMESDIEFTCSNCGCELLATLISYVDIQITSEPEKTTNKEGG